MKASIRSSARLACLGVSAFYHDSAAALVTDGDIIAAARGVAHNCVANSRLLATGLFDDVFVAPASGDAGGALGAALLASHHVAGHPRVTLAAALAEGRIIGWFQGRMEFGPRALGNRSILGDPRHPQVQAIMNRRVKFRESFRPFAPAVLLEDVTTYFEWDRESPYMAFVARGHTRRP